MTENNESPVVDFKPAHMNMRIRNFVIDYICKFILLITIGLFISTTGLASNFMVFLYTFIFYVVFEGVWQKTPGKWITKTKVVSIHGGKPTTKQILLRSICRFVPFEAFSFLSNKHPFGWHDKWSKTTVVSDSYTVENVKSINWVELEKENKRSVWVVVLVTLIVVAVVGILSSIVLQSLVKAREKANVRMMNQNQNMDSSLRDTL